MKLRDDSNEVINLKKELDSASKRASEEVLALEAEEIQLKTQIQNACVRNSSTRYKSNKSQYRRKSFKELESMHEHLAVVIAEKRVKKANYLIKFFRVMTCFKLGASMVQ